MVLTEFVPFCLRYREDERVDCLLINLVELKRGRWVKNSLGRWDGRKARERDERTGRDCCWQADLIDWRISCGAGIDMFLRETKSEWKETKKRIEQVNSSLPLYERTMEQPPTTSSITDPLFLVRYSLSSLYTSFRSSSIPPLLSKGYPQSFNPIMIDKHPLPRFKK